MQITKAEMKRAGALTQKCNSWTDRELTLIVKATQLTIAYLEGKGIKWQLPLTPLRNELESFQGFIEARKNR